MAVPKAKSLPRYAVFQYNDTTDEWEAFSGSVTVTGTTTTLEATPTTLGNGKTSVTTAGTRVVLASSTACLSVTIKANNANTGTIYVGNSSVSSANGYQLGAGEGISLAISNLNTINIDSSVNGEGVTYIYVAT